MRHKSIDLWLDSLHHFREPLLQVIKIPWTITQDRYIDDEYIGANMFDKLIIECAACPKIPCRSKNHRILRQVAQHIFCIIFDKIISAFIDIFIMSKDLDRRENNCYTD